MSYTIKYKRVRVRIDGTRPEVCECCLKKPNIIQCHHWKYSYSIKEVLANPELAKKNTSYLCYYDHRLANNLRIQDENKERIEVLKNLRDKSLLIGLL